MYYVYFLKSNRNSKIYVSKTAKLPEIRTKEHNNGKNIWTKQNGPFKLVYYEIYCCKGCATLREKFYKSGMGKKIKSIIVRGLDT